MRFLIQVKCLHKFKHLFNVVCYTFPPREMPPRKSSRQTSKETTNEDVQGLQQPHKEADQWICFINSERIIEVIFFEHPL